MRYYGTVYRPPSEAYSLIVQVTLGCSHNTCAFCSMYKEKNFVIRPLGDVLQDFAECRQHYRYVERIFLADGDALICRMDYLRRILRFIKTNFPECRRITCYASPISLLLKSEEDLRTLKEEGLDMVYMGLESGCDEVLTRMRKGHSAAEIIEAGQKARRCGLALSVTAISGLGGTELIREHALGTARALSAMNPEYIGVLTLLIERGTPLEDWVREGSFVVPQLGQIFSGFFVPHSVQNLPSISFPQVGQLQAKAVERVSVSINANTSAVSFFINGIPPWYTLFVLYHDSRIPSMKNLFDAT